MSTELGSVVIDSPKMASTPVIEETFIMYDILNAMAHRKQLIGSASIIFLFMVIFQITALASVSCSNFKTVTAVVLGGGCLYAFLTQFYRYGKSYAMIGSVGPCGVVPEKSDWRVITFIRNVAPLTAAAGIIGDGSQNCGTEVTGLTYFLLALYLLLFISCTYRYFTIMYTIDSESLKQRVQVAKDIRESEFFKENYLKKSSEFP